MGNKVKKKKEFKILMNDRLADLLSPGLENIKQLPEKPKFYPGAKLEEGHIGLLRKEKDLQITIACGTLAPQHIPLRQFVELVERMDTVIQLHNYKDQSGSYFQRSRCQILAILRSRTSCVNIIQGLVGRTIGPNGENIAHAGEYYIDRALLQAWYIAARCQLVYQDDLDRLLNTHDGWVQYQIIDPIT
jgi:hypothetical protein